MRSTVFIPFLLFTSLHSFAQTDSTKVTDTLLVKTDTAALPALDTTTKAFYVTGSMGISYEGYGLNQRPQASNIFSPRAPWHQGRLDLNPVFNFGNWLSIPVNINITLTPTNFAGPWSGFKQNGAKQSFLQWLTNPANNLGISPHFKWGDVLLGTQYVKYSDFSTGDIGIFGAGFDIHPKRFILKFFTGASQQGIDYLPPDINGSYLRNHWMMQVGMEKEGRYKLAFNLAKVKDRESSVSSPPLTQQPEESFTMSLLADAYTKNGWYIQSEWAQSYYTSDLTQPGMDKPSLLPFIKAKTSTTKDNAIQVSVGKKGQWVDAGIIIKYVGAGFKTAGYPMLQNDYIDAVFNTRITAIKSKLNFTGSIGQRTNNQSNTSIKSKQFIANTNFSYKFSEKWSITVTYNNTGFRAGSSTAIYGVRNVSNNIVVNPAWTFFNKRKTVSHLLSLTYNFSKYKEELLITPFSITDNNTHNITLLYMPSFFDRNYTPDFSVVYFYNSQAGITNKLFTVSSGLGLSSANKKWQFKGQLQYSLGRLNQFSGNSNFIAGFTADRELSAKLHWSIALTANNFKYGDELAPPPALINSHYLESNVKSGFVYSF
ncbi:MAG TPA: hypothetical protein PLZ45_06915 [Ferruginibacter sp.]|nr:hypothetical protein [Ferruginibacter sp.]